MNKQKYEIRKVLVLSTAHMPSEVDSEWTRVHKIDDLALPWQVKVHENGWWVLVPDPDEPSELPEWVRPLIDLAHKLECDELLLDSEGPEYDDVPKYDWE